MMEWWKHGNCHGMDTSLFFSTKLEDKEAAKQACKGCPVKDDCLGDALANGDKDCVRGGRWL